MLYSPFLAFQHLCGLGIRQSHYGAYVENTSVSDLVFSNDAVILVESAMMAFEVLREEAKDLRFRESRQVQVCRNLLREEYDLFMHALRTLISLKILYILVAYFRTAAGLVIKSRPD